MRTGSPAFRSRGRGWVRQHRRCRTQTQRASNLEPRSRRCCPSAQPLRRGHSRGSRVQPGRRLRRTRKHSRRQQRGHCYREPLLLPQRRHRRRQQVPAAGVSSGCRGWQSRRWSGRQNRSTSCVRRVPWPRVHSQRPGPQRASWALAKRAPGSCLRPHLVEAAVVSSLLSSAAAAAAQAAAAAARQATAPRVASPNQ